MKTLADYKQEIEKATTGDELHSISYDAFKNDKSDILDRKSISNQVDTLCIIRGFELKGYTKSQIKKMMK